jgi:hypothetical protein
LRKRGRRLLLAKRAQGVCDDPDALLEALAPHLIGGDPFEREVAELAAAALLVDRELDREALARAWRRGDGAPVTQPHVEGTTGSFLYGLLGLGPLSDGGPERRSLSLSDIGAELLARSLRHRATATR